jgi:formylglycine-generating enzyme required for sulfatase activity
MHLFVSKAAIVIAVALAAPAAFIGMSEDAGFVDVTNAPDMVEIAQTGIDFPLPGEFLAGGQPATAPTERRTVASFSIMKRQVSLAEYGGCVADGACQPLDGVAATADVPATGINWLDAEAYARWYSTQTGQAWRLPTALEAAVAAGERFGGETFTAAADDPDNPSVRWLRRYREEVAAKRPVDPEPKPRGHYGPNSLGLEDFGGNVWEWTSTCYTRVTLDPDDGTVESVVDNCGVHVLEGRHRAYMSNFVRDGKSGGCAVGTPPENLGFRLVSTGDSMVARASSWIRATVRSVLRGAA